MSSSESLPRYSLSANLFGHESDVKAVTFPNSSTIASASRDGTVKLWKPTKNTSPPVWTFKQLHHGTPYVNSIAWLEDESSRMFVFVKSIFFSFYLSN